MEPDYQVSPGHFPGLAAEGLAFLDRVPVSLSVRHGECLGVIGPTGSGKSLILRMLADLLPHRGAVWLDGVQQSAMHAPDWRRRVAYVASDPAWWAPKVVDHLPPGVDPRPEMEQLGLALPLLHMTPDEIFTGERQRFGLIRVLLRRPEVLLLDEPTSALDSDNVTRFEGVVTSWQRAGGILVLTSHDREQVARLITHRIDLSKESQR